MSGDGDRFLPGRHAIDAYGRGGFRFAGMSHRGSILCLPSGVRAWDEAMDEAGLAPVFAEAGADLSTLILGTGRAIVHPPASLRFPRGGGQTGAHHTIA